MAIGSAGLRRAWIAAHSAVSCCRVLQSALAVVLEVLRHALHGDDVGADAVDH
jgi:hypothetical protein